VAALIHDQGPLAWSVVIGYFLAAFLAWRAGSVATGRERALWLGIGIALVLLGANKQLDLQTDLTMIAKYVARKEGWYEHWRRPVQALFLLLLAAGATVSAIVLTRWLREAAASARVGAAGLVILLAFIFARAASFHHLDNWVTVPIAGMRSGWWMELLGIVVIGAAAVAYRRDARRRPSGVMS
jgi:MFS family permease